MENLQKQKIELEIQERELQVKEFFAGLPRVTYYIILVLLILTIPIFFISKWASRSMYLHSFAKQQTLAHPAIFTSLPVEIIESKILTMVRNSYAAFALVKNPNKDLVTANLQYSFSFRDSQDNEIAEVRDHTYLLGGEQKYVIVPQITLRTVPASVRVSIPDPTWKKRFALPNVIIQNGIPRYGDQTNPEGFFVASTIQNTSPYTLGAVRVNAIIFDQNRKVIGVSQYTANTVEPKESRDYKMFWPIPLAAYVGSSPQIIVETNILDPENLK